MQYSQKRTSNESMPSPIQKKENKNLKTFAFATKSHLFCNVQRFQVGKVLGCKFDILISRVQLERAVLLLHLQGASKNEYSLSRAMSWTMKRLPLWGANFSKNCRCYFLQRILNKSNLWQVGESMTVIGSFYPGSTHLLNVLCISIEEPQSSHRPTLYLPYSYLSVNK